MQLEAESVKKSVSVFVRMHPGTLRQCETLAEQAGLGVSTLIRMVLERALEEGVEIKTTEEKKRK